MPLDLELLGSLLEERCTVMVLGTGGGRGSGFFIDADLVLTCHHVVHGSPGEQVKVMHRGVSYNGIIEDAAPGDEHDLALVRVSGIPADSPFTAVAVHGFRNDNLEYFGSGFPTTEIGAWHGYQQIRYEVNAVRGDQDGVPYLLRIQSGGDVEPGISGGPLLDPRSGTVVGIMQYKSAKETGGGAIPVDRAAREFPAVRALLQTPTVAASGWRDALGPTAWRALGYDLVWTAQLDIEISGTFEQWTIRLDSEDGPSHTLTGQGLPSRIARALFQWAQRRRVHDPDDVKLLGELLGGALLPEPFSERVRAAAESDELTVRLHFPKETELFDVPWEFAQIQKSGGPLRLAADESALMWRVDSQSPPLDRQSLEPRVSAGAIGLLVQPADWLEKMPVVIDRLEEMAWPSAETTATALKGSLALAGRLSSFDVDDEPTVETLARTVGKFNGDGVEIDVIHYIGYGEQDAHGEALYALSDGRRVRMLPLDGLFRKAADAGARLLVVQFLSPRVDRNPVPVPPRAFLPALRGSVAAVVFTGLPVHVVEAVDFNTYFYRSLAAGETVERAMQAARHELQDPPPLDEDSASFAWFTLLTRGTSGLRLVDPDRGMGSTALHTRGGLLHPDVGAEPESVRADDGFTRTPHEGPGEVR